MLALGTPGLEGITEDLQKIIAKAPQYVAEIAKILDKAGRYLPTLAHIAEDPALPQVIDRIEKVYQLEKLRKVAAAPTPAAAAAVSSSRVGIGLERVVGPLDAFVFVREHPWVPWAAGAGAVVLLVGIGVAVGRATKRAPARR